MIRSYILTALLLQAVSAKLPSLVKNGSFENGLEEWTTEHTALSKKASDGKAALNLQNGSASQILDGLTPGEVHTVFVSYITAKRGFKGDLIADADIFISEQRVGTIHNKSYKEFLTFNGFEFTPMTSSAELKIVSLEEPQYGLIIDNVRVEKTKKALPPTASTLQNGSFEDVQGLKGANPHLQGFELSGWLVTQENVDLINANKVKGWAGHDGDWVLDLGGHGAGGIAQTVTGLEPESEHLLSFAYARHGKWDQVDDLTAELWVNDQKVDDLVRTKEQKIPNWEVAEYPLTANSKGEITLHFFSTSIEVGGGIFLDGIKLDKK